MTKKLNVKEIRIKLYKFQMELIQCSGSNKLVNQYLTKVRYMLMWMRMIRINKNTLKGWSMPDVGTIYEFEKKGKEELKQKIQGVKGE